MIFDKLERIMSNYKYTITALGILILLLNYMKFDLNVPTFYNQLELKTQVLFIGFLNFSILILVAIIILNRIDNQPLYRYTRLGEAGKRLILVARDERQIDLDTFLDNKFQIDELTKQARILEDYGWITLDGNTSKITKKGDDDLLTFVDLVFTRFK